MAINQMAFRVELCPLPSFLTCVQGSPTAKSNRTNEDIVTRLETSGSKNQHHTGARYLLSVLNTSNTPTHPNHIKQNGSEQITTQTHPTNAPISLHPSVDTHHNNRPRLSHPIAHLSSPARPTASRLSSHRPTPRYSNSVFSFASRAVSGRVRESGRMREPG